MINKSLIGVSLLVLVSAIIFYYLFLNWETYKNNEYGFEIKYPQELIIIENLTNSGGEFAYCINEQEDLNHLCKAIISFRFPDTNLTLGLFVLQKDKVIAKYGYSNNSNIWYHPNKNYLYELVYMGNRSSQTDDKIFNQMLSTFRFLE